jgi:signal transduction histidine kinase
LRPPSFAPRFLSRLQATGLPYGNPRVEQVLGVARLFLAFMSLLAGHLRPFSPQPYRDLAVFVLLGYTVHSLGLFIWLRMDPEPSASFVLWEQITDVLWPVLLCLFTDPPNSVFYIFFLFALVAAAFRYGLIETMAVAMISVALFLLQAAVVAFGPPHVRQLLLTGVDPAWIIFRCGYLLLTGFLLGLLAETEKELRAEIAMVNRLLSLARIGNRLSDTVVNISMEIAQVFDSSRVYEVAYQAGTGQMFRWEIEPPVKPVVRMQEVAASEHAAAAMTGYPHTFFMKRGRNGQCSIDALDDEGRRLRSTELKRLPMPIAGVDSILAVALEMGREWTGRFVVINAKLGASHERELRFAQNVTRQVAPALYSVYLFRRFRSRVGAIERARVARELHDTAIQSLISIEMQVDVLRRRPEAGAQLGSELERIQELLRKEVLNLRELMQTMRPIDIGPHQFLDFIAQLVERFRRDTGIATTFVSELQEVTLSSTACRELARMVQEGLVNIRKHSGARSALVRFGAQGGLWKLVIDDDGHGFQFAGRFTLTELDEFRWGPTVIKERVRAIGGDMVIESTPGHGSRLEITIAQKGFEPYGK